MELPVPLGVRFKGKRVSGRVRGSGPWFSIRGHTVRPDHFAWLPFAIAMWATVELLIDPLLAGTGPRTMHARVVQLTIALVVLLGCQAGILLAVLSAFAKRSTVRFARGSPGSSP